MSINYKNLVFIVIPIIILGLGITVILSIAQNNKFYVVFSDSMVPNINTGDIVVVAKEDGSRSSFANLKIGDVIVFLPSSSFFFFFFFFNNKFYIIFNYNIFPISIHIIPWLPKRMLLVVLLLLI